MIWIAIIIVIITLVAWGLAIRDNLKWKTMMEEPADQPERAIGYYNLLKSNGVKCRQKKIGSNSVPSQDSFTSMGRKIRIDVQEEDVNLARELLSDYNDQHKNE